MPWERMQYSPLPPALPWVAVQIDAGRPLQPLMPWITAQLDPGLIVKEYGPWAGGAFLVGYVAYKRLLPWLDTKIDKFIEKLDEGQKAQLAIYRETLAKQEVREEKLAIKLDQDRDRERHTTERMVTALEKFQHTLSAIDKSMAQIGHMQDSIVTEIAEINHKIDGKPPRRKAPK